MSKHTRLDEFLTKNLLTFKLGGNQEDLMMDMITEQNPDHPAIKNICAKVSSALVDEVDNAISILNCSKRVFVELAIIDALRRFDELSDEYDIYEPHIKREKAMEEINQAESVK